MEILKNNEVNSEYSLVVGIFEEENEVSINKGIDNDINKLIAANGIKKTNGYVNKIHTLGKIGNELVFLIGLGKRSDYSYALLEKAVRMINKNLNEKLLVNVDTLMGDLDKTEAMKKILLTVDYYDYVYEECKSKKEEKTLDVAFISDNDYTNVIEEYYNVANAISNTRDLVNKPYNYLNAKDIADYAMNLVKSLNDPKVTGKVLNKKQIEELKMGAFLGVNKGSVEEPKLIHLKYNGKDNDTAPISLIGKGVMFDTGGYSLKTNMINMKCDMGGAATVLGVFEAIVANNLKVNVQVIIAATDNRINGEALLPDDVVTAMNGKTIEILSTDAEGRLTLADALTYAQQEGSKQLIDLATLTGAVVVALGDYTTGAFGNDQEFVNEILKAGVNELESVWQLPITDYIREQVRGTKVADIKNSTGRGMGASGAAAFLEEFVEEGSKWVHLDIAGTAFRTSPSYGEFYGATGDMVKTLYHYFKNI